MYLVRAFEAAWATNASCTPSKDGKACRHFAVMALNRTGRGMDLSNPPAWGQDVHHAQFTHTILNASFAKCTVHRRCWPSAGLRRGWPWTASQLCTATPPRLALDLWQRPTRAGC